jgi:hypothetical protein
MSEKEDAALRPIGVDGEPLPPRDQPGYYPGFSTLAQRQFWDDATRAEILARVEEVPPIRFFSADEAALLTAIVDRVLPQDDRTPERRIPIVPFIDERLHAGRIDGYRFADMPPDGEAHRLGLQAVEACARARFSRGFMALSMAEKEQLLKLLHDGKPPAAEDIWRRMPVHRYWLLLLHDVCQVYYAHPWAWDEIGFGGPAYPRGYMRLENGQPEPWEVEEQRYMWQPPANSVSGDSDAVAGNQQYGSPGQGGTH